MCNNPNLVLVNISAYTNFGKILSICSEEIERKLKSGGWTDGMTDNPNPV